MARKSKQCSRERRHRSLRKKISGTAERPRLVVYRSARHIYAQVVDDDANKTVVSASDLAKKGASEKLTGKKGERAKQVGAIVAKQCIQKGIVQVVFDRAGYRYHGRVSLVAQGAREAGLKL